MNYLKWQSLWLVQSIGLYLRLMTGIPERKLRNEYHKRVMNLVRKRWDPGIWLYYLIKVAFHYHAHQMATEMASGKSAIVNSY